MRMARSVGLTHTHRVPADEKINMEVAPAKGAGRDDIAKTFG